MKRFALAFFASMLLTLTSFGGQHIERYGGYDLPYDAFGYVTMMTMSKEPECEANCEFTPVISSASAIVIETEKEYTRLLTAGHVCAVVEKGETQFVVKDFAGSLHFVIAQVYANEPDLCLLETNDEWGRALNVTKKDIKVGDKGWNLAAPFGVFEPGMVLSFEGIYSGRTSSNDDIYTIPAAPGSSGSAIINEKYEIIGIIHSALLPLPHIALSSTPAQIRAFLKTSKEFLDAERNKK
jgi:hypothetical protein